MATPFIGVFFSLLTGIALTFYYMFNKKVAVAGDPLQIIFWVFAMHLPPILIWVAASWPLQVGWEYFLPGMGVLTLTVTGNLLAIRALSLSPFSLVVPVMCLSPVFTSLIGIPLLQEWPSVTQWLGIFLAVAGVLQLYAPKERPWDIFSFWPAFFKERGAPSMALSALSWAVSSPMDKLALRHASPAFHAFFVFSGLVIFLFIWLSLRGEWRAAPIPRVFWGLLAVTGACGAAADILQLFSLLHTNAGTFEAIKRVVSQVMALGIGVFLFKEQMTKPKIIGIAIISIGVPMIVF